MSALGDKKLTNQLLNFLKTTILNCEIILSVLTSNLLFHSFLTLLTCVFSRQKSLINLHFLCDSIKSINRLQVNTHIRSIITKFETRAFQAMKKSVAAFILQHEKKPVVVVLSLALKIVSCKFEDKSLMKIQTEMNEKLML